MERMPEKVMDTSGQTPTMRVATAPIDRDHLVRMSLGNRLLERELLQLFDRQAVLLVTRIRTAPPGVVSPLAQTLKKSAQIVGAWQVARAAEAVELADGVAAEAEAAQNQLAVAVEAARSVVARLLIAR